MQEPDLPSARYAWIQDLPWYLKPGSLLLAFPLAAAFIREWPKTFVNWGVIAACVILAFKAIGFWIGRTRRPESGLRLAALPIGIAMAWALRMVFGESHPAAILERPRYVTEVHVLLFEDRKNPSNLRVPARVESRWRSREISEIKFPGIGWDEFSIEKPPDHEGWMTIIDAHGKLWHVLLSGDLPFLRESDSPFGSDLGPIE